MIYRRIFHEKQKFKKFKLSNPTRLVDACSFFFHLKLAHGTATNPSSKPNRLAKPTGRHEYRRRSPWHQVA